MKERIQKVLANAGVASRRNIEEMVLQSRIEVNGRAARGLPVLIDPETDRVEVDGEPVELRPSARNRKRGGPPDVAGDRVYVIMNKPTGVYSTNVGQTTAQGEQVRAVDLLPPGFHERHRVYPVGRLDAESRGLLLLTNDGDLTNKLTHPRYGVPKTYRAAVDGLIGPEAVAQIESGLWLSDPKKGGFKTGRCRVKIVRRSPQRSIVEITLKEGRNRQVRRMLAKLGHKVRELTRVKLGPLELGSLKPGESRLLSPKEVRELHESLARGQMVRETRDAGPEASEAAAVRPPARRALPAVKRDPRRPVTRAAVRPASSRKAPAPTRRRRDS